MSSVMLSFGGTSANGAWDDRELVKSYDAAMEEFHLHHPGPGSWLDKMTAKQAVAASSSAQTDTSWYTASDAIVDTQEEIEPPSAFSPSQRPAKRARKVSHRARSGDRQTNPYSSTSSTLDPIAGPVSPQYSPPSPIHGPGHDLLLSPRLDDAESESEETSLPATTTTAYPPPPAPISIIPTNNISSADAVTYAMTAQYWAGYWMGVSQALQSGGRSSPPAVPTNDYPVQQPVTDPRSNVVKTKHQVLKR